MIKKLISLFIIISIVFVYLGYACNKYVFKNSNIYYELDWVFNDKIIVNFSNIKLNKDFEFYTYHKERGEWCLAVNLNTPEVLIDVAVFPLKFEGFLKIGHELLFFLRKLERIETDCVMIGDAIDGYEIVEFSEYLHEGEASVYQPWIKIKASDASYCILKEGEWLLLESIKLYFEPGADPIVFDHFHQVIIRENIQWSILDLDPVMHRLWIEKLERLDNGILKVEFIEKCIH